MKIGVSIPAIALACAVVSMSCTNIERQNPFNPHGEEHAGRRIYQRSCAACHGENAKGDGPVAPVLTVEVPDLTRIRARRNGEFPELEIFRIIDGRSQLAAHGSRHMPVWGHEFFGADVADDENVHREAADNVNRLVAYLRSIQW